MQEIRNQHNENINAPNDNESRLVQGYAIVFNSESVDLGGFTEIIEPDALDGVIERSDILCLLNHDIERGVLARCKFGDGSLILEVDEHGLKYEFEAPKTALGDEILEGIRRGDISKCSFGFTVEDDEWIKREDGTVLRRIKKIKQLYDVSLVYSPAYEETEVKCDKRGLYNLYEKENISNNMAVNKRAKRSNDEILEEMNNLLNELKSMDETVDEERDEEVIEETEKEPETEVVEDVNEEETTEEEREETEEVKEEEIEDKEEIIEENRNHNIMKKTKFSLVGAIKDVVNHRNFNDITNEVIKEGRSIADASGISANGQIVLPVEKRAEGDGVVVPNGLMATETTYGKEAVATDTWDIVGALRDKLVLADAGAQFITVSSNIDIPVYDGNNCYWESEIGEAKDGAGKFSKVSLTPKRLTCFVDLSKMLLNQTSASIENMVREDLINAVAEKLQKTILGDGAGSAEEPKGLFNGITAQTADFTYGDTVNMEEELETANVYGDYKYIVSPTAKAKLRTTSMDKGSGKFIYDNNAVLGVDAYSTNSVVSKGIVVGDFKQMVIANFGAIDVTVDEVSRASFGQIRLVINFYVDYAVKRPQAFVKRILK